MNYRYYIYHKTYRARKWHRSTCDGPPSSFAVYVKYLRDRDGKVKVIRCRNQSAFDLLHQSFYRWLHWKRLIPCQGAV